MRGIYFHNEAYIVTHPEDISNVLAARFESASSSRNYGPDFPIKKEQQDRNDCNFFTHLYRTYNTPLTISELDHPLKNNDDFASRHDPIHNLSIKHFNLTAKEKLLDLYSKIWFDRYYRTTGKNSTIISLLKNNKDCNITISYRTIPLPTAKENC